MRLTALPDLLGTRVLVVGDVMLDEYVWGAVRRISPEAPVPVVEINHRSSVPGGAANVATGIAALGGSVSLAGVIGQDGPGETLAGAVRDAGINTSALQSEAGRHTTTKTRIVAHAQQVVRTDIEDRRALAPDTERALIEDLRRGIETAQGVVISDYGKGAVSETIARETIAAASAAGAPVVVDTKAVDYSRFRGATVITPNQHDAGRAANVHVESDADLLLAVDRLAEACDGAALLVTRGEAGMSLFTPEGVTHIPAEARSVYDVTGAGDTVVAVLTLMLAHGARLEDAVGLANTAAGIVVGKVGTAAVGLEELARAVGSRS